VDPSVPAGTVIENMVSASSDAVTVDLGASTASISFIVISPMAEMIAPAPGSTLPGASATFSWTAGVNAQKYWLDVGNSAGSAEYATGAVTGYSKAVNGLPCDGRAIYVSLYTFLNGASDYLRPPQRYTYTAASGCGGKAAEIASPAPGSALAGSSATFSWNAIANAQKYWLDVGNSTDSAEYATGAITGNSKVVNGLPCDGRTIYASLYTFPNGASDYLRPPQRYTYAACRSVLAAGPQPVSVNPGAGSGWSGAYTFTFSAGNGWQNINVANILINNFIDGRNACYLAVVPSGAGAGSVYLVNDAGDAGGPYSGMALPGSGTAQNSQCSISGAGSSISGAGTTLTVTLAITFRAAFAGNRIVYVAAQAGGANSGWQALGTWAVPGNTPNGTAAGGVTPVRSSGPGGGAFTFTFTDTNGWQDLDVVNILINDALDARNACYLAYSRPVNVLYLVGDAGGGLLPGLALNNSGAVSNSQCTITGAGSSASAAGNALALTLNMTFASGFAGNRIIYMAARSSSGGNTGWQAAGTRTVSRAHGQAKAPAPPNPIFPATPPPSRGIPPPSAKWPPGPA
jgi:hypothetical protein